MANKLRVALLAGGKSGEREVSLNGAREVMKALDKGKYEVIQYDPSTDLEKLAADSEKIDVVFILLHGPLGEDGSVQGFLDLLDLPYQGSGILGSAIAMNKHIAKIHYRLAGLPVPDWRMVNKNDYQSLEAIINEISTPLIIKPVSQGSSIGMTVAKTEEEVFRGLKSALEFDREVMIEKYIHGREITVGVLGNDELTALPIVEIIPGDKYTFFDYEAKYVSGATREICPAEIPRDTAAKATEYGLKAHKALCLQGYSRTDMMVSEEGIFLLETNTIPGMTPTSLFPQAANAYGLSFSQLLDRLLELALENRGK